MFFIKEKEERSIQEEVELKCEICIYKLESLANLDKLSIQPKATPF